MSGTSTTGIGLEGACKDSKGYTTKFTGTVYIDGDQEMTGDITSVNTITVKKDVLLTRSGLR